MLIMLKDERKAKDHKFCIVNKIVEQQIKTKLKILRQHVNQRNNFVEN